MPLIEDNITSEGAVITVLLGVSQSREAVLRRAGFPVPAQVPLRLLIDSGSFATGVPLEALRSLEIEEIDQIPVGTLSTRKDEPHMANLFDVSLQLLSGVSTRTIPSVHVIAGAGYDLQGGVNGILGRDILDHCHFMYLGPERRIQLGF